MSLPDPDGAGPVRTFAAWFGAVLLYAAGVAPVVLAGIGDGDASTETRVLRWSVAALGVFAASAWLLLLRTRQQLAVMEDLLADVRFGAGTKRDRDAVDILIRALRAADPSVRQTALTTLRKITSRDLGEDPKSWEAWWAEARNTFSRSAAR